MVKPTEIRERINHIQALRMYPQLRSIGLLLRAKATMTRQELYEIGILESIVRLQSPDLTIDFIQFKRLCAKYRIRLLPDVNKPKPNRKVVKKGFPSLKRELQNPQPSKIYQQDIFHMRSNPCGKSVIFRKK